MYKVKWLFDGLSKERLEWAAYLLAAGHVRVEDLVGHKDFWKEL